MNIITLKNKMKWAMGTSLLLYLVYFLCRYMFIHLHGMKEWPFDLLVFGLIIISVAAFLNARRVMVLTVVGYIGGFAMGIMFGIDGVDPGGGKTNNKWLIWTLSFIIIILVGVIWEMLNKYFIKNR